MIPGMLTLFGRVCEHIYKFPCYGLPCCSLLLLRLSNGESKQDLLLNGCVLSCRGHEVALGENQKVTRQKKRRYNEINHVTSVSSDLFPCRHERVVQGKLLPPGVTMLH